MTRPDALAALVVALWPDQAEELLGDLTMVPEGFLPIPGRERAGERVDSRTLLAVAALSAGSEATRLCALEDALAGLDLAPPRASGAPPLWLSLVEAARSRARNHSP